MKNLVRISIINIIKIVLLSLLLSIAAFGEEAVIVDERINDIYFANGIMTTKREAKDTLDRIIAPPILKSYNNKELEMNKEAAFKLAYNHSYGFALDMLETFNQKKAEHKYFWIASVVHSDTTVSII